MRAWLLGLALVVLVACGGSSWQPNHYAGICLDDNGVRVPNEYCAIGDPGTPVGGFAWGYAGYPQNGSFDVPLVGYPVNRTVFVQTPPPVQAIYIDRGSFADTAPAGMRGNAQRISVNAGAPVRPSVGSPSVTRGGLGSTSIVEDDAVAKPTMSRITAKPPARRLIVTSRKKR